MTHLTKVTIVLTFVIKCLTIPPETFMLPPEMIKMQGYPCEQHTVTTSDGYVLIHYRIPGNNKGDRFKPNLKPVMVVHGFISSAKDFLLLRNQSLPYKLADAGYDVWLINLRGAEETSHIRLLRDDKLFWDFGQDEHGGYDIPETIEYILNATKSDKVNYIGHSMGCTVYIFMCNERPDLKEKIHVMISLTPGFFVSGSVPWARFVQNLGVLQIMDRFGMNHLQIDKKFRKGVINFCNLNPVNGNLCYSLFQKITHESVSVSKEMIPLCLAKDMPFTLKQINHFIQILVAGYISKYDYGIEDNKIIYGKAKPPEYNFKACTAPNFIFNPRNNEDLISAKDIRMLVKALGGSKYNVSFVPTNSIFRNHLDVLFSATRTKYLFRDILKILNKFNPVS